MYSSRNNGKGKKGMVVYINDRLLFLRDWKRERGRKTSLERKGLMYMGRHAGIGRNAQED